MVYEYISNLATYPTHRTSSSFKVLINKRPLRRNSLGFVDVHRLQDVGRVLEIRKQLSTLHLVLARVVRTEFGEDLAQSESRRSTRVTAPQHQVQKVQSVCVRLISSNPSALTSLTRTCHTDAAS